MWLLGHKGSATDWIFAISPVVAGRRLSGKRDAISFDENVAFEVWPYEKKVGGRAPPTAALKHHPGS